MTPAKGSGNAFDDRLSAFDCWRLAIEGGRLRLTSSTVPATMPRLPSVGGGLELDDGRTEFDDRGDLFAVESVLESFFPRREGFSVQKTASTTLRRGSANRFDFINQRSCRYLFAKNLILSGTDRARTCDLMRVKHALFQLSYDPEGTGTLNLSDRFPRYQHHSVR